MGRDTLVVEDSGNLRVSLFRDGVLVGEVPTNLGDGAAVSLKIFGADSRGFLMESTQFYPNFAEPWLEGLVGRLSPTGERVDTLLTFDWIPGNDCRRLEVDPPHAPST